MRLAGFCFLQGGNFCVPSLLPPRLPLSAALLHKSVEGRATAFPGRTYPAATVTGTPRAVEHGDADLDLRTLPVEVPNHEALAY
jgi:hypothetical protein